MSGDKIEKQTTLNLPGATVGAIQTGDHSKAEVTQNIGASETPDIKALLEDLQSQAKDMAWLPDTDPEVVGKYPTPALGFDAAIKDCEEELTSDVEMPADEKAEKAAGWKKFFGALGPLGLKIGVNFGKAMLDKYTPISPVVIGLQTLFDGIESAQADS